MISLSINPLQSQQAWELTDLILESPEDYRKYFHPFDFRSDEIARIIQSSIRDIFFGVEILNESSSPSQLIGFYMLRGLDEGFTNPMYGVFISHLYSGKGIATLTVYHALAVCRILGYERLLLKVAPSNVRAIRLYEHLGFGYLRNDKQSENLVLFKAA
jgi:RimJ/RimL family protein N-acetyltransferase